MFRTPKTRAWTAETNRQEKEAGRQAQVYLLALHAHREKASFDPLDSSQWRFLVLPRTALDARTCYGVKREESRPNSLTGLDLLLCLDRAALKEAEASELWPRN